MVIEKIISKCLCWGRHILEDSILIAKMNLNNKRRSLGCFIRNILRRPQILSIGDFFHTMRCGFDKKKIIIKYNNFRFYIVSKFHTACSAILVKSSFRFSVDLMAKASKPLVSFAFCHWHGGTKRNYIYSCWQRFSILVFLWGVGTLKCLTHLLYRCYTTVL